MSHGAGGEIRRSFYDPASREPSLGGQMAVCGRGHLEAASAGKQLRLRPASGSWRRPRGRPWPGGPSSPGPGSVLSAASAGECQLVLGAWGGRSLPPPGRSRRLASRDLRDCGDEQLLRRRPCRRELRLTKSRWVWGVRAWWAGTAGLSSGLPFRIAAPNHFGPRRLSTQVLLQIPGDLSTYVKPIRRPSERPQNRRLNDSCFRDSWWCPEEFLVKREWGWVGVGWSGGNSRVSVLKHCGGWKLRWANDLS